MGAALLLLREGVTGRRERTASDTTAVLVGVNRESEVAVIEKLDFLVRFWELSARHATLGSPLGSAERLELLSLMQLVNVDAQVPPVGHAETSDDALPAQLIGEGAILAVEMRDVSASGMRVACADTMKKGARVVVRTADAVTGVEYVLPCTVAWVHRGAPNTMALVVDGIPSRKSFFAPIDAQARSALAMGRHERLMG
jgi:hypothetical protein